MTQHTSELPQDISDLLHVPTASIAAPDGCVRVTVLNRKRKGITVVFRLQDIEEYMRVFSESLVPCLNTPVQITMSIAEVLDAGRVSDEDAPFVALMALWVARENEKTPLKEIMGIIAKATGRVALQLREVKAREWTFLAGIEKGTREGTPVAHYPKWRGDE